MKETKPRSEINTAFPRSTTASVTPAHRTQPSIAAGYVILKVILIAALFTGIGCRPGAQSPMDEQRDPNFLAGKSKLRSMDYEGAVECFQAALRSNPKNASAHFELGWLYEQQIKDYAAAIYNYERFIKLRPNSPKIDIVKQHIFACKQELAKTVALAPVSRAMMRQLEELTAENNQLKEQVKSLSTQLAAATQRNSTPAPTASDINPNRNSTAQGQPTTPGSTARTHTVKQGDTFSSIARRYGIKLEDLISKNPGINPRRLQLGQEIKIP
ncbi:MAG: LysM peptidoglycan-binding domain-containing protein [Verrucomicrobia bacterium]|nr:LysM peptidoglycan-binding domain-containing protein [Verrucomicrobiota bacterium]MCF7708649.1 LysM peptidoglycan-binding domain-containing protein [Verrucomicrobiota bacterium]